MKIITIFISFLVFNVLQLDVDFPVDEFGKYTFSEVVEVPGMDKDKLFANGQAFMKNVKVLKSKKNFLHVDNQNYTIQNKGSFYVYRYGSVKKAIDGAVEYDINIELKEGKYRYTITNFLFNEYQRNRYGKFEPVSGKYTPLEVQASSFNEKTWEKYKEVVYEKSQELIINLYGEMIYQEEKKPKKVKKDDNW